MSGLLEQALQEHNCHDGMHCLTCRQPWPCEGFTRRRALAYILDLMLLGGPREPVIGPIAARLRRLAPGSWWTTSKSDPRWNLRGRGLVGLLTKPAGVDKALAKKQAELGEEPPGDLVWEYMKD